MATNLRVALIGLDTSHTIEFARRMQAPDCPADQRVEGLRAISCLRFPTPFQNEEGLDKRQAQLEAWGVKVTTDSATAVADCDVIMVEINDPAFHLEYFAKVVALGKPVFLDKPMADSIANGRKIFDLARKHNLHVCSGSSLRFVPELIDACTAVPRPTTAWCCGPLGQAPAGSGIIWYGVHAFEMLQRAMGLGAQSVQAVPTGTGFVNVVEYTGGRHGVVELLRDHWTYTGTLRTREGVASYTVNMANAYVSLLKVLVPFCQGGPAPVTFVDTLEVMAMLDAADRSSRSGKPEPIIRD